MRYEISWWQFASLMIAFKLSVFTTYTTILTGQVPPTRDAWISSLLAAAIGFALTMVAYILTLRFPGQTMYEYVGALFGPVLSPVCKLLITAYFLHWAAVSFNQVSYFLSSVTYLLTPEIAFVIAFAFLAFVGASEGIEFISRIGEFAALVVILGLSVFFALMLHITDLGIVRPVLDEGFERLWRQTLTPIAVFGEGVWVTLIVLPHLSRLRDAPKAIATAFAIEAIFICVGTIIVLGIFGPELLSILSFPAASASRLVSAGNIVERLDWLVIILWVGAQGVKVSFLVYSATQGIQSLLSKVPLQHWGTTATVAMAAMVWTRFLHTSLSDVLEFSKPEIYLKHALPLQLAPVLFLLIAWVRRLPRHPEEVMAHSPR